MENYQKYLDPHTLASLEGLDLQARMVVEGYVAGMHPSPYHGFSVEFAEHREYVPGDDIRHVDWKVWSKTDKLYLKQYEEETNLLTYLLLDTSESMAYASGDNVTKLQYAQFIAASLAYMILQQQDSVGLVVYDDAVRRYLKPAGQTSQLKELLHLLDVTPAREKSDLGLVFNDLAERFKKRGVVVDLLRLVRRSRADRHRAQAFSPPPPRGHRVSHPRPGRARFPVPGYDALQGAGRHARHLDRSPCAQARLPGRAGVVLEGAGERLPDG